MLSFFRMFRDRNPFRPKRPECIPSQHTVADLDAPSDNRSWLNQVIRNRRESNLFIGNTHNQVVRL